MHAVIIALVCWLRGAEICMAIMPAVPLQWKYAPVADVVRAVAPIRFIAFGDEGDPVFRKLLECAASHHFFGRL
eukprot:4829222-Pyramimonas_sp.AAC.1